ncbi:cystine transport system substrate-binding protein [Natronobacillus azotifigens]|uniref:Transporter substrate-binding domain-containing protein n=1 Tax=Natronobacillus azotifigens TaxID=472978 RepID=A0A9J6RBZ9_9BACI|nr:transporter substrate-binding domain-containing protein [Natronobacillus azotifigens]MCZ0702828.1 transporter substrate-binding domain-containing protein [Natronobacillus azotifigens]
MLKKILFMLLFAGVFIISACGTADTQEEQELGEENVVQSDEEENADGSDLWSEIEESGEITAATSGTLIAASYYNDDDELTGYDVEVMKEIANRLGVEVSFEIMGIDSMLSAINSGRVDLAVNDIEITDGRKEQFNFSDPYKYSFSTMVVRKDDYSGIHSLEDLAGKKAGGGATTIYSQIAEHYGAEIVTYGNANNEAYLRDVHNGNTDVIVNDYYLSTFGVGAFPDFDIMIHPELQFHPTQQGVIMPKGEDRLTEIINQTLAEMREDGTLSELATRFYGEDASEPFEGEIEEITDLDL